MNATQHPMTVADVLAIVEQADLPATRRRDMTSALKRIAEMLACAPVALRVDVIELRAKLASIRPAAHDVSNKTWSNLRSLLIAALELAGAVEPMGRGVAQRDPVWAPLVRGIAHDRRVANGLASFLNWCAQRGIAPDQVDDAVMQRFRVWLEAKTLYPKPRDVVRRIPNVWNDAAKLVADWPANRLTPISFRAPSENIPWHDLNAELRTEAEDYLKMRLDPDVFDTDPRAPRRALAPSTVEQQRKYLHLAANVLIREGWEMIGLSLASLVEPAAFKVVLRYYHAQAEGKPNAFTILLAKTLIDIARYHVKVPDEHLTELKRLAAKLPQIERDLTEKNKQLLRQLECERTRARLLFLPEVLVRECKAAMKRGELPFVKTQVAVGIDIQLVTPLRPQNLIALNWRKNFIEPRGPAGPLILFISKNCTKSKKRDLTFEIPEEVADTIRWYRRHITPLLGADPFSDLFVNGSGTRKHQETLACQIEKVIEDRVGLDMSIHQFRHVVPVMYLEEHPERFQDMSDLLGHAWAKTTMIYVGNSTRRASRAYNGFIMEKRKTLKLRRQRARKRRR